MMRGRPTGLLLLDCAVRFDEGSFCALLVDDDTIGTWLLAMLAAWGVDTGAHVIWLSGHEDAETVKKRIEMIGVCTPSESAFTPTGWVEVVRTMPEQRRIEEDLHLLDLSIAGEEKPHLIIVDAAHRYRGAGAKGDSGSRTESAFRELQRRASKPGCMLWGTILTQKTRSLRHEPPRMHTVRGAACQTRIPNVVIGFTLNAQGHAKFRTLRGAQETDFVDGEPLPGRLLRMSDQCTWCQRVVGRNGIIRNGLAWCAADCIEAAHVTRVVSNGV